MLLSELGACEADAAEKGASEDDATEMGACEADAAELVACKGAVELEELGACEMAVAAEVGACEMAVAAEFGTWETLLAAEFGTWETLLAAEFGTWETLLAAEFGTWETLAAESGACDAPGATASAATVEMDASEPTLSKACSPAWEPCPGASGVVLGVPINANNLLTSSCSAAEILAMNFSLVCGSDHTRRHLLKRHRTLLDCSSAQSVSFIPVKL